MANLGRVKSHLNKTVRFLRWIIHNLAYLRKMKILNYPKIYLQNISCCPPGLMDLPIQQLRLEPVYLCDKFTVLLVSLRKTAILVRCPGVPKFLYKTYYWWWVSEVPIPNGLSSLSSEWPGQARHTPGARKTPSPMWMGGVSSIKAELKDESLKVIINTKGKTDGFSQADMYPKETRYFKRGRL